MSTKYAPESVPPSSKLNQILAMLAASEYERLLPDLHLVAMPRKWTMSESGDHVN